MNHLGGPADISINVMSYNEHDLIISTFEKYLIISKEFNLTFNLNLTIKDILNPQKIIDIFKLISLNKCSINLYVRHHTFTKRIECLDDIYNLNSNNYIRFLTFAEHLSIITKESNDSDYIWFLGAGDYPNKNALNILYSSDINNYDLISFDIHHSVIIKSNEISNKIKIRRTEAISSTIYKRTIVNFQTSPEHVWPHLLMLCMISHSISHALISYHQTQCAVYVAPNSQWIDSRSKIYVIEIERINLALNYPSNNILEWDFSKYEINHALNNLGFNGNEKLIEIFNNSKKLELTF